MHSHCKISNVLCKLFENGTNLVASCHALLTSFENGTKISNIGELTYPCTSLLNTEPYKNTETIFSH